jgi:hypothetical protein
MLTNYIHIIMVETRGPLLQRGHSAGHFDSIILVGVMCWHNFTVSGKNNQSNTKSTSPFSMFFLCRRVYFLSLFILGVRIADFHLASWQALQSPMFSLTKPFTILSINLGVPVARLKFQGIILAVTKGGELAIGCSGLSWI